MAIFSCLTELERAGAQAVSHILMYIGLNSIQACRSSSGVPENKENLQPVSFVQARAKHGICWGQTARELS